MMIASGNAAPPVAAQTPTAITPTMSPPIEMAPPFREVQLLIRELHRRQLTGRQDVLELVWGALRRELRQHLQADAELSFPDSLRLLSRDLHRTRSFPVSVLRDRIDVHFCQRDLRARVPSRDFAWLDLPCDVRRGTIG